MRLFLLAAVAAIISAQSGFAADLSKAVTKAPAMVPAPTWTGWYAGLNAGYGWGNEAIALSGDPTVPTGISSGVLPGSLAGGPAGFIGGGQVGYNHQTGQWLLGVEADFQGATIKDSQSIFLAPGGGLPPFLTSAQQTLDWFGTLRGRIGFVPSAPWLIYATAGLAYGHVKLSASSALSHPVLPPCFLTFCGAGSASSVEVGWTAGGGVEYALSRTWSLKAEYLYYDLGNASLILTDLLGRPGGLFQQYTVNVSGHIARGGFNYRFGG